LTSIQYITTQRRLAVLRTSRFVLLAALAVGIAACGPAASTQAPTSVRPPTSAAVATPGAAAATPTAVAATASPGLSAPPSVGIIATVPPEQLLFADKLVICSDLPYPPQEYFDDNGNPIGSDIEIGQEIARRLGLTAEIINSFFDTIIPALTGGKCDIIISAQNIIPERLEQVDMVPFFQAGQAFMVQAGNPSNINATEDLCAKKIAVQTGTTQLDFVQGTGTHKDAGLPKVCSDAGQPAAEALTFQKDPDAVAALQAGSADVYMADLPVVIGYADAQPEQFELSTVPQIAPALQGISVPKTYPELRDAVKAALISMINDGTYLTILTKYKVEGGAITVDQVNAPPE
jgi:polar amino acid transport system substrate-binding protein